jgi:ssDNA-binding Zn-finger/Zn-ribbon topoisomerase 1
MKPQKVCPECGSEMELVEGSKGWGRGYDFWYCKKCDHEERRVGNG